MARTAVHHVPPRPSRPLPSPTLQCADWNVRFMFGAPESDRSVGSVVYGSPRSSLASRRPSVRSTRRRIKIGQTVANVHAGSRPLKDGTGLHPRQNGLCNRSLARPLYTNGRRFIGEMVDVVVVSRSKDRHRGGRAALDSAPKYTADLCSGIGVGNNRTIS